MYRLNSSFVFLMFEYYEFSMKAYLYLPAVSCWSSHPVPLPSLLNVDEDQEKIKR